VVDIALGFLVGISFGIVGWQIAVWSVETLEKHRKYEAAVACCRKLGKPLLVAGGPWGSYRIRRWLRMPAHGFGNVCLDIERRAFEGHPCGIVADVTQIPFRDKAFGAVFASHLLEHLPSISAAERAVDELNRVAEAVYIVCPSRQSVWAWLHSGHHLWVWQKGTAVHIERRNSSKDDGGVKQVKVNIPSGVFL
jgi:hypothetical protein